VDTEQDVGEGVHVIGSGKKPPVNGIMRQSSYRRDRSRCSNKEEDGRSSRNVTFNDGTEETMSTQKEEGARSSRQVTFLEAAEESLMSSQQSSAKTGE